MREDSSGRHWVRTRRLMVVMVVLTGLCAIGIAFAVNQLNALRVLGFPAGFFMAAVGTPLALALLAAWYDRRQDRIDGSVRNHSSL